MKIFKKFILILLACVCLILLIFLINQVYAKYLSSAICNASVPISRWNIEVNNNSIKTNSDISASITPVFPGTEHIASNIIAPTAEGYFDLDFDWTNVDVSFKYDVSVTASEDSAVKDIIATGYSIDGGDKISFANYEGAITNTIPLSSERTKKPKY